MSGPIIVIYHRADFDGIFSREIAKRHFGESALYLGWDYGDPVPVIDDLALRIYMIDISIESLMGDPRLIWIDHHKTQIEKFPASILGYRIDGVAACRLAWQWFRMECVASAVAADLGYYDLPKLEDYRARTVEEPLAVTLAGEYDIWDKRDGRVDLFQAGLRSQDIHWRLLLDMEDDASDYVHKLLRAGEYVQHASREGQAYLLAEGAFDLHFEGLRFLAINAAMRNSDGFKSQVRPEHDACLSFVWSGKKGRWKVSLRGVPHKAAFDLSPIAIKHGGGGHRQACGFECDALPFTPIPRGKEGV